MGIKEWNSGEETKAGQVLEIKQSEQQSCCPDLLILTVWPCLVHSRHLENVCWIRNIYGP